MYLLDDRTTAQSLITKYIRIELTTKKDIENLERNKNTNIKVYAGFLVGIAPYKDDYFLVLTKNFKDYDLYNMDDHHVMSLIHKNAESRKVTVYTTKFEDQIEAVKDINELIDLLDKGNKTVEGQLIDFSTYDISPAECLFVDEEGILENISNEAITNKDKVSQFLKDDVPQATKFQESSKGVYTSQAYTSKEKEPMFFKRTKTKPSTKLVDKLRYVPTFIGVEKKDISEKVEIKVDEEGDPKENFYNMFGY